MIFLDKCPISVSKMKLSTIIVILIINSNLHVEKCSASHTSMCLGLPVEPSSAPDPPQSLGIENLFPPNVWHFFKIPIEQYLPAPAILQLRPIVTLYSIRVARPGEPIRYLNGWFKVEVELMGSKGFVLCAHDAKKMPVGQFSDSEFPSKCGPTLPNVTYNIVSCNAAPVFEPDVPSCIVYIHPSLGNWNRSSPLYGDPLAVYDKLNFYWHFSHQACNLKEMIHFRGYFIQKESEDAIYHPIFRDIMINSGELFGAADPPPQPSHVQHCDELVVANEPPWVSRVEGAGVSWTWIYGIPFNAFEDKTGCQSNYFGGRCIQNIQNPRESLVTMEIPKIDNLPKCQTALVSSRRLTTYNDYINHLNSRCTCTPTTTTSTSASAPTRSHTHTTTNIIPIEPILPPEPGHEQGGALLVNSVLGNIIWGLRKSHAITMIIVTMFLSPVSIFIARYFKESFMSVRIVNDQVWYFAHIHITMLSVVLIVAGMICVLISNSYMGKSLSLAASLHCFGGWVTIVVIFLMAAIGGCRTKNMLSVCTHWFFGIFCYVSCYLLIWNSVYIPGSPIADFDVTTRALKEAGFNMVFGYLIGWVVVDLTIHVIMSLVFHATDSSMNLTYKRLYVPPPIPVIHKDTKIDIPGTGFRMMCFFIHGAIAFVIASALVIMVLKMQGDERTFGPHSCTHGGRDTREMAIQKNCWYYREESSLMRRGRSIISLSNFNSKTADYFEKQ